MLAYPKSLELKESPINSQEYSTAVTTLVPLWGNIANLPATYYDELFADIVFAKIKSVPIPLTSDIDMAV